MTSQLTKQHHKVADNDDKIPKYENLKNLNVRSILWAIVKSNLDRIRCPLLGRRTTWCSCSSDCLAASSSPWLPEAGNYLLQLAHQCVKLRAVSCRGLTTLHCCVGNTLPHPTTHVPIVNKHVNKLWSGMPIANPISIFYNGPGFY